MDNSENEQIDIPSDDEVSIQATRYFYSGGGTILSPSEPDNSSYDSNYSNPPWSPSLSERPYHEQLLGCSFSISGRVSALGSGTITLNDSSTITRARIATDTASGTMKFSAIAGNGYKCVGIWQQTFYDEYVGWTRLSSSSTYSVDVSRLYIGYSSSEAENYYIFAVFVEDAPATYNNIYRYINTSGLQAATTQTRTYGQNFTTLSTSSISEYVSNGWSLYGWANSSGDTDIDFATNTSLSSYNSTTGTIYLYAISSRTIRINYNANGGSNVPSATSSTQRWNQYGNNYNISNLTITSNKPTRTDFYVENFPEIDGTNTSETIPWGVTYLATSTRDLDTVFGSGNYEAEFSDLVSDILKNKGNNLMYWTRDVGSNLNNAECITRFGTVTQAKMQNLLGVRITVNVKTFGCL